MTEYDCPAEGCDYTASKASVQRHINAKSGAAHSDVDALRAALDAADDDADRNDHPESEGQQGETTGEESALSSGAEGASSGGDRRSTDETDTDQDMTDDDEVSEQWNGTDDEGESEGQQGDDGSGTSGSDDRSTGAGLPLPTAPSTLALLLGGALALVLVWRWTRSTAPDHPESEGRQREPTGAESGGQAPLQGGVGAPVGGGRP